MNRRMVYTGALPQDLDLNQNMQFAMIALGFLAEAVMGQNSWALGFTPAATTPASLTVDFGRGAIGEMTVVDQTNPGSSDISDTTDPLMKVGINLGSTPIAFTPPSGAGQSQVFLVQGQMQEADTGSEVLPYYNATTPSQPFSGPNNTGAANNTIRAQTVALQVVAGAPATTGSQVAPSVTAGWVPLYLLTLANGQTTITAAQVTVAPGAPFVAALDANGVQGGRLLNTQIFTASGTYTPTSGANAIRVRGIGGGGAGGGAFVTTSSSFSTGSGGAAGSYAEILFPVPESPVTVTIGAGGTPASGAQGAAGGTTSLGSLLTCPGGGGGPTATIATTSSVVASQGAPGATPSYSGGTLIAASGGQPGPCGFIFAGFGAVSGQGAQSPLGAGGVNTAGGLGGAAQGPGAGGAGSANGISTANSNGGPGASGIIIIEEYS